MIEDEICFKRATKMFGKPLPDDLKWVLADINSYAEKLGGKLVSRQVIAMIIVNWQNHDTHLDHYHD